MAFLAAQESSPAHSFVLKGFQSRLNLFLKSYCKLLVGVSQSIYKTADSLEMKLYFSARDGKLFINS
jgi:hypothetical protein